MTRKNTFSSARRLGATAAITAGLVAGGVTVASAASTQGTAQSTAGAPGGFHGPGDGPHGAPGPGGTITAVSSSSITISTLRGSSVTYAIDSTTKVSKDRATASVADLAAGESVRISPSSTSSTTAASIDIEVPHLLGTVTGVDGATITIRDQDGFWRTISTNGSTTYSKSGATTTASSVTVGEVIVAEGSVDANHTTLDAASVMIGLPSGADGPGAPLGR